MDRYNYKRTKNLKKHLKIFSIIIYVDILQRFNDMELFNIVNNIYQYIEHPIVENTDIKEMLSEWVKTDTTLSFSDYYFHNILFDDFNYDNYLEDAAERYLSGI